MNFFSYTFLFLFFISCTNGNKNSDKKKLNAFEDTVNITLWSKEILNIDSVFLNGRIGIIEDKSKITEYFGQPNKIMENKPAEHLSYILSESLDLNSYTILYDNISFEGVGKTVMLKRIDLKDDNYIKELGLGLEFKNGLHVREVCKYFSESCKLTILGGGNTWSGHIELRVSDKPFFEDLRWFLIFKHEFLVSIELHRFL